MGMFWGENTTLAGVTYRKILPFRRTFSFNARSPPASAKLPKPNARWRDGFSLVPSIPVGFADKRKVGALVQSGIIAFWSRILYWTLISLVV
jgi:hypothetical protein